MTSMTEDPRRRRVVIGVDTHKYVHVAVALDVVGGMIGSGQFSADRVGYEQLLNWATGLGGTWVWLR
jgi:transposase